MKLCAVSVNVQVMIISSTLYRTMPRQGYDELERPLATVQQRRTAPLASHPSQRKQRKLQQSHDNQKRRTGHK